MASHGTLWRGVAGVSVGLLSLPVFVLLYGYLVNRIVLFGLYFVVPIDIAAGVIFAIALATGRLVRKHRANKLNKELEVK